MTKFIKLIGSRKWKISRNHNGLQIKAIPRRSSCKKELKNWVHLFYPERF